MSSESAASAPPGDARTEPSEPAADLDNSLDIPEAPKPAQADDAARRALERKAADLEANVADLNDKLLRALAEGQNIRKRAQREIEDAQKYAVTRFARDMLSVADNLGRALAALPADADGLDPAIKNVLVGVEATGRELATVFERHGVKRVEALDQPFNPELHQAVVEIDDAARTAGTVVQEMMPGYTVQGRLLRAAMVAVSKGGPPRGAEPVAKPVEHPAA